ncbi:hypothetical protein Acr_24g0016540 [Actinidia rufa]|uniref:Uncharacterized protein n=1 Tax=Actinidia rufa TaxID=165716 RepID=A0A7J0GY40_9ERIC|nr:hypothetical protein Acr_24g0016540 [Actinidia rufa]
MAKPTPASLSLLLIIIAASVATMVPLVEAARQCSQSVGKCNSFKQCKAKCKAQRKGWAHCVLSLSCTCFYPCGGERPPQKGRKQRLPPPPTDGGGAPALV